MISVDLAPEVHASLRAMSDAGSAPQRCQEGVISSAVAGAVTRLQSGELSGIVRPWHLSALQRRADQVDDVTSVRAVSVDTDALVVELIPGGQRLVFLGTDDGWRLVRFVDGVDVSVRRETTRPVELHGWGPDAVLEALGITKPDDVELEVESEDLGQGETETRHRYQWTDGSRSILAEQVKNEIFDGATPYTTYVRGVIIDGDRGVLLTGKGERGLITEG
ncbi:MAG TPA: hypothetical protein VJ777_01245 [Mycobacterium sp.]|nr:hypothetical protein [Mycobacterium sp.]